MPKVSAVIPAHDEAATIAGVILPLLAVALIDDIIVVDDGSSDDTAARARAAGAKVVSIPFSGGKAAAMARGVAAARNDIVYFSDADVTGLTSEMVASIVEPVAGLAFAMFVGIRGRKTYWANRLLHFTPIIGGQRALRRELWDQVPSTYKKNFQIEIALNFFAKQRGHRMGLRVVPGFGQVIKERKRGLLPGLRQRFSMVGDILIVSWRLYVLLQLQLLWERWLSRANTASEP
jgi:glycosyltransferase involved in cell wall biosynthesis